MSGYVIAGYLIVLGTLAVYAASLLARQRAIRRRLPPPLRRPDGELAGNGGEAGGELP